MDAERWARIQSLFHDAIDLPAAARSTWLREACAGDTDLESEVLALLDADNRGAPILDRGVDRSSRDLLLADPAAIAAIGPYRIVRVIGEGGMGIVFLAERTDLGTQAAIKVLRDAWLSPARRHRFAAEQRTLARLDHPGIARLFDAGTLSDGTPWIVMEYVDGVPLTDHCRAHVLPIADRLRLVRAVCDAVQHAHQHLIVHRDLKPSNVLVTRDGRVKLLDFGISKQLDAAASDETRMIARLMTPAYAAPEQQVGAPAGVYTDVYSLGVMLYELVAGRIPFDSATEAHDIGAAAVPRREPRRPSAIARTRAVPDAPPETLGRTAWTDLDVICLTAMQNEPARRYATVDALGRDIDHFLHGEPLDARPDALPYVAGKFLRRHRGAIAAATTVVLLVVSLVAFYTTRLATARNEAITEATRARRIQDLLMTLFTGGDEAAGPSEDLRVVTLLDRGVQEAGQLRGEPVVQAEMLATLGKIYGTLGNLAKADTLLDSALERRRALHGTDSAEVAESLIAKGLLRSGQARYDEAEQLVRDGLAMTERHRPATDPAVARATAALGQVLEERGDYPRAIQLLEQAVGLHREAASADLAFALRHLANAHFYAGHYDTADTIARRVLDMTRLVQGEKHPLVAEDLINLGAVQHERGRYEEAERYYREALPITEAWYGPDHYQTASNLTMLGRTLVYQKRYDEAVVLLERALAIQERVFGPNHPRVASAVNDLGTVALQRNRLDEAEAAFTRMADIYRSVYGASHYLIATADSNLGSVYMARKDYRGAEALYRRAIAMYAQTQSPTHVNTAIAQLKLGRALLRQRRYAEAETAILAGYTVLSQQASPSVSWLQAGRQDLATLYDAIGQPDKARAYRDAPSAEPPSR
jgi:serine/threonine-protein kinase